MKTNGKTNGKPQVDIGKITNELIDLELLAPNTKPTQVSICSFEEIPGYLNSRTEGKNGNGNYSGERYNGLDSSPRVLVVPFPGESGLLYAVASGVDSNFLSEFNGIGVTIDGERDVHRELGERLEVTPNRRVMILKHSKAPDSSKPFNFEIRYRDNNNSRAMYAPDTEAFTDELKW